MARRRNSRLGLGWLVVLAASASSAAWAGDPDPSAIDPRLHTSVASPTHRLLVYRICSPEHCWSDGHLQWLEDGAPERSVKATKPVEQLGYGIFVRSARWDPAAEPSRFEVQVVPSHGDLPERTLLVIPTGLGRYETRWKDGGDAAGPPSRD